MHACSFAVCKDNNFSLFFYFVSIGYNFSRERVSFSFALQALHVNKRVTPANDYVSNKLFLGNSDVDVTGISEYSANNSNYQVTNGSVTLQTDNEKYQVTDDSMSESESNRPNRGN